ncbi:urease accessory protein UreE [Puniceibacterium sp. IMCC21224]|uniref:urease accessory protein UreE n=1 Tax=Puniceibacterium sp. IMCC21224 TaxID=1618204 RepID=UPI00065D694C|nr:urease accessory protein UreE [Puniceibacterium sp. IMCC21224]KMK68360.1 urease accessory protein UreE [Puniceibacterium sp. IMCC21224]
MSAPFHTTPAGLIARTYHDHTHSGRVIGRAVLEYEARFLRRKVVTLEDGRSLLADLPHTTSLNHGGALVTETGDEIAIVAAKEPLLEVTGDVLPRIAWHIGNRHTPCQILSDRLLIQRDHVIRDMLQRIGAHVVEVFDTFTPEGGAYGHGRTHGHDHGHSHDHSHGPDDDHTHDHTHDSN